MALPLGNGGYENWGESGIAETSLLTDTSTAFYTKGENQVDFLII